MPEESPPQEECGVFGVWAPGEDVAKLTYFGLYALQHRGQEAAGIAVSDGSARRRLQGPRPGRPGLRRADAGQPARAHRDRALPATPPPAPPPGRTRSPPSAPRRTGHAASRSATTATWSTPPSSPTGRRELGRDRRHASTTDSDLITGLLAAHPDLSVEAAALEVLPTLRGAFSLVFMDEHTLYAARDAHGVRPLVLGRLERGWVVASETAALDIVGASFVREVEPGELIAIDERRPALGAVRRSRRPRAACSSTSTWPGRTPRSPAGTCTRPGSRSAAGWPESTRSRPTWSSRCPSRAPRPRSATPRQSGIPYGLGLVKNSYVGRTFIQPSQTIRQLGIRLKLNPLRDVHAGQADRRRRRLDRARQHPAGAGPDAARGRRARGARADLVAAGEVAVLLRHRLRHPGRADRQRAGRRGRSAARSAPTRSATSRWRAWSAPASSRRPGCAGPASTATTRSRCRRRSWSASTCWRASSGRSPPARPARPATRWKNWGSSTRPPGDPGPETSSAQPVEPRSPHSAAGRDRGSGALASTVNLVARPVARPRSSAR